MGRGQKFRAKERLWRVCKYYSGAGKLVEIPISRKCGEKSGTLCTFFVAPLCMRREDLTHA